MLKIKMKNEIKISNKNKRKKNVNKQIKNLEYKLTIRVMTIFLHHHHLLLQFPQKFF